MKLPKSVTRTMYITYQAGSLFHEENRITLFPFDSSGLPSCDDVCLGTIEVTFDVPQQSDITGAQVAKLRRRRDDVMARATAEAGQIDRQIQELLALPAPGGAQ